MTVTSLASGSSGNAILVSSNGPDGAQSLLIDAGLGIRAMLKSMRAVGANPRDLAGIVLSHEHIDHIRSAIPLSRGLGIPVIANRPTLRALYENQRNSLHTELPTGETLKLGQFAITTFPVPHDAADPVGVSVSSLNSKVTCMTDIGHVSPAMKRAARGSNLLVLEANHDVHRLRAGPYPDGLKARILSDRGHLSNEAAAEFLVDYVLESGPTTVWLAHMSKVNNLPKLAYNYVRATLSVETNCPCVIGLALRDIPSASWAPGRSPLQLNLF